jgi:hypothetical protein
MAEKVTCGVLYLDAFKKHTGGDPALVRAFSCGWIGGQCEKVYLWACDGCMFRPSPEHRNMVLEIAEDAAARYGLYLHFLQEDGEVWVTRYYGATNEFTRYERNSPRWHRVRAKLCGIPEFLIDEKFHERRGYNEPADRVGEVL